LRLRCLRYRRRRLRDLLRLLLPSLTATLLAVIPLILAIVLRRLGDHHGLLRLLDLRLSLRSRHLLLTAALLPIIPLILTIVLRRLRNHNGLLRLLNLRWRLRSGHLLRLLEWRLRLLRPATLLTATLLTIILLPADRRLRNHCGLRRLLDLRSSLRLRNGLSPILLTAVLLTKCLAFSLGIHLADLATRT